MQFKDYYTTLGVTKSATADEIKKAFRKLAREFHPDKNPGNKDAEAKFKEVNEAYEVLGDPEKRKKYDQLGSRYRDYERTGGRADDFNWQEWAAQQGAGGSGFGGGGFSSEQFGGMSDFFKNVFGGGGGFGSGGFSGSARRGARPQKGADIQANAEISLEEAFKGTSRLVTVGDHKLEVKFKPGIADGQTLKISGKGAPGKNGGPAGDLLIGVTIEKNDVFERRGDDLFADLPIDLYTAILGGAATIATFRGKLKVTIPAEAQQGQMLKLKGQGMPHYGKESVHGDLYVRLQVQIPKNLSAQEKELFKELAEMNK
ncbi:MAG TPA: J domain-containing protein [Patescibacteria group bacterium]|nr:J domain-containing protein [Patescibacteria group bacterium]